MTRKTKKIFISSTSYDLEDVRSEIVRFLKEALKQEPVYFESPDFTVKKGQHSHDICIDAVIDCDICLLIIDRRYGGIYHGTKYPKFRNKSITWAETEFAHRHNIPIYAFVRQSVWDERPVYKKQKNKRSYKPVHVDDRKVFDFIDFVVHLPKDNWIDQFKTIVDLKDIIVARMQIYFTPNVYSEIFKKYTQIRIEVLKSKILTPQKFYVSRKKIENEIRKWIEENKKGFTLIVGGAGCGKTHLLFNLASEYLPKNYAVLFIESDWVENFKKERLEDKLFSEVLTSIKSEERKKTLLLLDTLDLVAYNRGIRKLIEFIADIKGCDEAIIIGTIRPSEYESLKDKAMIIDKTFFLQRFNRNEVNELLNRYTRKVELTKESLDLLTIPLYAHMFMEIYEKEEMPMIANFIQLYDKYWEKKVVALREGALPSPDYTQSVRDAVKKSKVQLIYSLVSEMFHQRLIRFNKTDFPRIIENINYGELACRDLLSERVLIEYGNYVEFFHPTFFDYSTARCLLEKKSDDQLKKLTDKINLDDVFYGRILEYLSILAKNRERMTIYQSIMDKLSASLSHLQHITLVNIMSNLDKLERRDIKIIEDTFRKNIDSMDYMLGLMISGFWTPQEASFDILKEFSTRGDYETKRRIAEALQYLAPRNIKESIELIGILRNDYDEKWKTDIRRRIVEVVPYFIQNGFLEVDEILKVKPDDEPYVIVAIIEGLDCLKQKNLEKANKLLNDLTDKLEEELRSFVIWAFDLMEKIKDEPYKALREIKAVIYEKTPSLILITGDDIYRIFVSRNLYRILGKYPSDVITIMTDLMSSEEHNNVRRPLVRHIALRRLIQFAEECPDYVDEIEKLLWALATDKDPIIPVTFSDNLAYIMKVTPETIRKIINYYRIDEGKNILSVFPDKWRKIFLRRLEDAGRG